MLVEEMERIREESRQTCILIFKEHFEDFLRAVKPALQYELVPPILRSQRRTFKTIVDWVWREAIVGGLRVHAAPLVVEGCAGDAFGREQRRHADAL